MAPIYSSGIAFGRGDTHGYINIQYNDAAVYVGGGNADNLNWTKALAFSDHSHSWDSITGKPSTFAPSGHIHAYTDIIGGPTFSLSGTTLTISC